MVRVERMEISGHLLIPLGALDLSAVQISAPESIPTMDVIWLYLSTVGSSIMYSIPPDSISLTNMQFHKED